MFQKRVRVFWIFVLAGYERGLFLGLGLGGPEVGFPPELFDEVYAEARRKGIHVVAHAGETVGAESVWGAIPHLAVRTNWSRSAIR